MPISPAPLAGGYRAGNQVAEQLLDSTAPPLDQIVLRLLRRRRQIEALHRLGSRVVGELLEEIARYHGLRDDIDQRLARYAQLDPDALRAVGGDRFAPLPVHAVSGREWPQ
jgi:hypothetical protein